LGGIREADSFSEKQKTGVGGRFFSEKMNANAQLVAAALRKYFKTKH
jgi:hypothetical protein